MPPSVQPKNGWVLVLRETGGTVRGETFDLFVKVANDQLRANGHAPLQPQQLYARVNAQAR